jgi:hypothetical protein
VLRVHDKDWPFFQLLMLNILPGPDINFPQLFALGVLLHDSSLNYKLNFIFNLSQTP